MDASRCRACERSPLVHVYDSWTCPARYLETSSGEVTYYKQLNPEDTRTFKLFKVMNFCKIVSGHFLEFDLHIWRTGGAAGGRTWRMNPAVQRSVLLFTAHPHGVGPHHQKLWILLVFPSWRLRIVHVWLLLLHPEFICVLPVSLPSRACVCQHVHSLSVNPLDIHRLYSNKYSLRNFTRRLKGKVPLNVPEQLDSDFRSEELQTVMLSQSPVSSHMDFSLIYSSV